MATFRNFEFGLKTKTLCNFKVRKCKIFKNSVNPAIENEGGEFDIYCLACHGVKPRKNILRGYKKNRVGKRLRKEVSDKF